MPRPVIDLLWPAAGLNRRFGYEQQPPYSTVEALNVRPEATPEGRMRGGSRPGLMKAFPRQLATEQTLIIAQLDGQLTEDMVGYRVDFVDGESYEIVWAEASSRSAHVIGDASHESGAFTVPDYPDHPGGIAVETTLLERRTAVRMMSNVHVSNSDGRGTWDEPFNGPLDAPLSNVWSPGIRLPPVYAPLDPPVLSGDGKAYAKGAGHKGTIRDSLGMNDQAVADGDAPYSISMMIHKAQCIYGLWYVGVYTIWARVPTDWEIGDSLNGAVEFQMQVLTDGTMQAIMWFYEEHNRIRAFAPVIMDAGQESGTMYLQIRDNHGARAFWNGVYAGGMDWSGVALPGTRVGFSLQRLSWPGGVGTANTSHFKVNYYSPDLVWQHTRRAIMVSAGAKLFREDGHGDMKEISTVGVDLADDRQIMAAEHLGKLYIADYGFKHQGYDGIYVAESRTLQATDPPLLWRNLLPIITPDADKLELTFPLWSEFNGLYEFEFSETVASQLIIPDLTLEQNGSVDWKIARSPKVYDPVTDVLEPWESTIPSADDIVPLGCSLIVRWMGRMVLAGDPEFPHAVYMSKMGDAHNYNYGQLIEPGDITSAISLLSAEYSMIGEPITALIAFGDDYLIFGCTNSIWIQRGDPILAGIGPDNLSRIHGIVGATSWCLMPDGAVIFLSRDGLYVLPPAGAGLPVSLSKDKLPRELMNVNPAQTTVVLEYDSSARGVHISLAEKNGGGQQFWFGIDTNSFWPVRHSSDHTPHAMLPYTDAPSGTGHVLLGCRDGFIRTYRDGSGTDDGIPFDGNCWYGPIQLGADGLTNGIVRELVGILAEDSGDVRWGLHVGRNAEAARKSDPVATGLWKAGRNHTARPQMGGSACFLKVEGAANRPWAMENVVLRREILGRMRMP
jgi:hypothetical protein